MNKIKYKKIFSRFFFYIGLAILWFAIVLICTILSNNDSLSRVLSSNYIGIAMVIYAIIFVIYFAKFVSTEEFQEFEKENIARRYEKKKRKGTLYKVSFFEKKKFYYVTVPM